MNAPPSESPPQLRHTILTVATRLFAEQGFAATSIRQIVEACGCTNPSLYYYFTSKEDLYRKVIETQLAHITGFLHDWGQQDGPLRARLHAALSALIAFGRGHPESFRLLHRLESNAEDNAPAVDMSGARALHLQLMGQIVSQGIASGEIRSTVDPTLAALALAGIVNFQLQHALFTGAWNEDAISRTLDLLFDGIAA